MPLSTPADSLSSADRLIIQSPTGKARRAQVAALLPAVRPQLGALTSNAPSYVVDAIGRLMAAFDRWTEDEQNHA